MKCPDCGRTMIAKVTKRRNGSEYCYFCCYGYSKGKCARLNSISSLKLEPEVLEAIKEALNTQQFTFSYKMIVPEEDVNELEILKEQLGSISLKEERIKEAYRNGIDTLEEYKSNKDILSKEREEIENRISEHQSKKSDERNDNARMYKKIKNVYELLISDDYTNAQKNEALRTIVDKLVYDRENDTLKIYYYLAKPA